MECRQSGRYKAASYAEPDLGNPVFLDREGRFRDRALFDLAIDSKFRGCDLVKIMIGGLVSGSVRTDGRCSLKLAVVLERRGGTTSDFVFPSRIDHANHMSTRQYARLLDDW